MYYPLALFAVMLTAVLPGNKLRFRLPVAFARFAAGPAVVPLAVVILVSAQHAYLAVLLDATYHESPMRDFMARMPVRFISGLAPHTIGETYRTCFALLVLVESFALSVLYCGLEYASRAKLTAVAIGMALAYADAATSKAATSADMYAYVGFMLLGTHAYAPTAAGFAGAYALINVWWHTPMVSAAYGPLWLAIADCAGALGHSLFEKIEVLRLLGVVALLGTAAALTALKIPLRIVALIALNPALIFEFIANVHNDLLAVLLLLVARYATVRGAVRIAIVSAVAAGLVKLPFLLFAALAFVPLPCRTRRLRAYGITLASGLALSCIVGGRPYLAALYRAADEGTAGHAVSALIGASIVVKIVAVGAVALALAGGVFVEACAWTLPALCALLHPWYLSWTLPYSVESHEALRNVAVALPVVMLVADAAIGNGTLIGVIGVALYVWLALSLVRALKARFALRDLRA